MALSFFDSKDNIPIAKIRGSDKIIYLVSEKETVFERLPTRNVTAHNYKCPYCKKILTSKVSLIHHVTKSCEKKKTTTIQSKVKIDCDITEKLVKLPLDIHEVIIVTGAPGCGKSYWTNEYVKMYKKIFDRDVYLISRLEQDQTLAKDAENYLKIDVDKKILDHPLKLTDFEDSLVIFDDIENSEFPKATDAMYNLLADMCKNGRHHNISVIFCNQESRMGKKTKPILSCITGVVIFPKNCSFFQTEKLLKEHLGLSKGEIADILKLNSRSVYINRSVPQYIISDRSIYMIGKEIYS